MMRCWFVFHVHKSLLCIWQRQCMIVLNCNLSIISILYPQRSYEQVLIKNFAASVLMNILIQTESSRSSEVVFSFFERLICLTLRKSCRVFIYWEDSLQFLIFPIYYSIVSAYTTGLKWFQNSTHTKAATDTALEKVDVFLIFLLGC